MNMPTRRNGRFLVTWSDTLGSYIRVEYKSVNAAKKANRGNLTPNMDKK